MYVMILRLLLKSKLHLARLYASTCVSTSSLSFSTFLDCYLLKEKKNDNEIFLNHTIVLLRNWDATIVVSELRLRIPELMGNGFLCAVCDDYA